jgi:hypothetical protein
MLEFPFKLLPLYVSKETTNQWKEVKNDISYI